MQIQEELIKSPLHPGGRPTGRFKDFSSGVFAFPGHGFIYGDYDGAGFNDDEGD